MDLHCTDACNFGSLEGTQYRVSQETGSYALALSGFVQGKPSQHNNRNRVRHIALDSPRRVRMSNCAGRQGVVTGHFAANANYIRPRGSAGLIIQGAAAQPFVEHGLAGIEHGKIVLSREFLGWTNPGGIQFDRSQGGLDWRRRRSLGLSSGGLSSMATNFLKSSSDKEK
jgi:hypothetical protein